MLKRILAIIISCALLFGCAIAETAAESEAPAEATGYQIEMKTFPLHYLTVDDIWREDFPLYFINGADDLPFVEVHDWADVLNMEGPKLVGENYQVTLEVKEDENKAVFTRENNFYMEIDFEKQTLSYLDFLGFIQKGNGRYIDPGSVPKTDKEGRPFMMDYTKTRDLYGDYTVVDLGKYAIPIIAQDGKYLVPMQTMLAFSEPSRGVGMYFNGQDIYFTQISLMTDPGMAFVNVAQLSGFLTADIMLALNEMTGTKAEIIQQLADLISKSSEAGAAFVESYNAEKEKLVYAKYFDVPKAPRSEALIRYGYSELCLEMDSFYGLKDTHNITDFNNFFAQNGLLKKLLSPDAMEADSAVAEMVNFWLDDGHSAFLSASCMAESDPTQELGFRTQSATDLGATITAIKNQHPEALLPYYEVDDTAYITFDNFTSTKDENGPGGFADYYKLAEEGKLEETNDTLAIIINAHKQIMRENSPIKNVVLDMSSNGGGEVFTGLYTLAWLLGEGNVSIQNQFTGAQSMFFAKADVNLDRQFDEQDTVMGKGLNIYCLIAPPSFSCGNLVPWVLKADGRATLLGKTSGGGSCMVGFCTTAWGTSFRISSYNRLSFVKNGSYYDVDKGVEPDHVIDNFDHYYDRAALTEYIHSLY